jgi:cilia- and flagella-associated protein 57
MEKNNQKNISDLEEEYKKHLDELVSEFEDSKKTADQLKMMYEEKLSQQEEEHETEIHEQNEAFLKKIAQLTEMID